MAPSGANQKKADDLAQVLRVNVFWLGENMGNHSQGVQHVKIFKVWAQEK